MATGTVKSFSLAEGFGFITPDDGSDDVRVELKAAEQSWLFTLIEGERVFYSLDLLTTPGAPLVKKLSLEDG
ncbi:MAG: cold-shock protein [Ponticaulis sp.]|nr:cold-shock protein [Ponticaulis sp.]